MRVVQRPLDTRGSRVSGRLHVRGTAREENAVDARQDFRDVERCLEHGNQQRQTVGRLNHGGDVFLADAVKVMVAQQTPIRWNADERFAS